MTTRAGERIKLVAVIRVEYEADPENYFDDLADATPEGMAAIDQANVLEGGAAIEDLLYLGEVESVHVFPLEED